MRLGDATHPPPTRAWRERIDRSVLKLGSGFLITEKKLKIGLKTFNKKTVTLITHRSPVIDSLSQPASISFLYWKAAAPPVLQVPLQQIISLFLTYFIIQQFRFAPETRVQNSYDVWQRFQVLAPIRGLDEPLQFHQTTFPFRFYNSDFQK